MKIGKYLTEARSKEIDEEFTRDFVEKHCQNALKGTPIYRGIESHEGDYYIVDPISSSPRISPYTDSLNYYNLLLSNLPEWKKFPPRNLSIVCTTSYKNAHNRQGFDDPYLVLPKDGSKIGVCPEKDIWYSFDKLQMDMSTFNRELDEFFELTIYDKDFYDKEPPKDIDRDYQSFVKACEAVDSIKENLVEDNYGLLIRDYIKGNQGFLDFIDYLLNPIHNNFYLAKAGSRIYGDKEVWTDGKSILLSLKSDYGQEIWDKMGGM